MILQPRSLCRRLLRDSSNRSRGSWSVCLALGPRNRACDFSTSLRRRNVANHPEDRVFQSSCWSVLSSSPSAISSSISTFQIQKTQIPAGNIPLLAVLVTPAHIALLNDRPEFVPNILRHTFELDRESQKIDVLAAVVDRIPYPSFAGPVDRKDDQTSLEGAPAGAQIEDGSEGVSFAVLDSNFAAPDLWSARAEAKELDAMTIQQRCTLSFAFPPTAVPIALFSDGKERTQPLVSRVLQLPVANTLFQNGKTSTLIAQRWRSQGSTESSVALSCSREAILPQQTLHMADVFSDQSIGFDQSLHSYLLPITPTRTITAAIGNIIRRISIDDISGEGVPASEELERAISTAIKDSRIPAEQAGIWALVRPPNYSYPGQPGVGLGEIVDHEIQEAVLSGCRLHKVLSGGGGWGEKQGLLALDPDPDYRMSQQAFEPSISRDQDVESEKLQAFGDLVSPGGTVKFYVYRSPPIPESMSESSTKRDSTENPASVSLRFGSLPSKMDAMPNAPGTETKFASQSSCMILKHHFGMLSEQGMSLESTFLETNLPAGKVRYLVPKLLRRGLPPFEVLDERVLTTKLDAPYMTWAINEEIQTVELSSGENWREPETASENVCNRTPQKGTKTGTNAIKRTMTRSLEAKLETLDDFMEAMSTMPSHQHVATTGPHPRDRRREEGKAGDKASFEALLAIGRETAERRGRPAKQLIRKFETASLEVGAASVSLSKFGQVQSSIHDWIQRSTRREDMIRQTQHLDTSAIRQDVKDIAHTSQHIPDDFMSAKSEETGKLQPKIQLHRGLPRLRIRKHVVKLPSVMNQLLSSSVRRRLILEPSLLDDDDKAAEEKSAENESRDSVRHPVLDGWNAWDVQQRARQNEPEIETEALRLTFIPEPPQEPLPVRQSGIKTEPLEQLAIPRSESELDTAPMGRRRRSKQMRRRSGKMIRQLARVEEPSPIVRKFDINPKALYNIEMAGKRKDGLLKRRARPMPEPKEELIRPDPTWDKPPAYKKLQDKMVRKHISHEAPPTDARDKAMRLHKEYHLPLLTERDTPRP